jgi:hypothetical protein
MSVRSSIPRRLAHVAPLFLFLAIASCDDKPQPRTAHQTRAERLAHRKAQAAIPAKRIAEFDLNIDRDPFLAAGCVEKDERTLDCRAAPFIAPFGCEPEVTVENLLGGLKPRLAMVACRVPGDAGGVAHVGCKRPTARKFIVWDTNAFSLIASADTFSKRFAPPKNAEAALGFALAQTRDSVARFDLRFEDDAPVEEDTMASNVLVRPNGWVVRLFERQACGCTHPDFALDVFVSRDGDVKQLSRTQVHVDPRTAGRCVD